MSLRINPFAISSWVDCRGSICKYFSVFWFAEIIASTHPHHMYGVADLVCKSGLDQLVRIFDISYNQIGVKPSKTQKRNLQGLLDQLALSRTHNVVGPESEAKLPWHTTFVSLTSSAQGFVAWKKTPILCLLGTTTGDMLPTVSGTSHLSIGSGAV